MDQQSEQAQDVAALTLTAKSRRAHSLREVQAWGRALGNLDAFLREFLDQFYVCTDPAQRQAMLDDEPALGENVQANAYLAAVAEHLALRYGLVVPDWTNGSARFLQSQWFPCGLKSLEAILLEESPPAFRRRLIFVGEDPLYRPRRDAVGIGNHFGEQHE